ncbi:YihY/virulence factor BrkB family protein [Streptomyces sp. Tu 2975]|uniref:YhjD/YihY/BrkB family envelope integrity protein n=1 Tax=Streptomyces sp. Tu 2975 TaxID=2676871 RepID=UPI00135CDD21|nr:YhjD/YihY/BrkB family envelope integrity protein [Streptomyces sp. Tu 2975]QIP83063.1 YihY/virulence factor BrkB family protein [Streptomyces sp. Tu 2975]
MGGEARRGRKAPPPAGHGAPRTIRRLRKSRPGRLWDDLWSRLTEAEFFDHALQLSALALLCFFPMLIVLTEATGRDTATVVIRWLGLNQEAAKAVASLIVPGPGSDTVTVTSGFLMALGAMAVAGTLQSWYRLLFDVPRRGWRDVGIQVVWLVYLLVFSVAQAALGRVTGGLPLRSLAGWVWALAFWWGTVWVLLSGAVRWRTLLPTALATSVCWSGLGLFSMLFFSASIVANEQRYGPIGVVMIIISWLVAVGVIIHLGAVVGRMITDRVGAPRTEDHGPTAPDARKADPGSPA